MKYETKLHLHADLRGGGVMNVFDLVEYPGVQIVDTVEKRGAKLERTILYDDQEFETIAAAIEQWKWTSKPSSD